jgi:hypothetical protein
VELDIGMVVAVEDLVHITAQLFAARTTQAFPTPDGAQGMFTAVAFVADLAEPGPDGRRPADQLFDPGGLGVVERVVQVGV